MHNIPGVKISNSSNEFFEEISGYIFIKFAASSDIVEQITTCTKFHEKKVVMFGLYVLKHLNDVRMTETSALKHRLFVEHSLEVVYSLDVKIIYRLYGTYLS